MNVLKEGGFQKITPMPVFVLSPVHANLLDGLKFLCAMIALLSEWKYDVVIPAPNREVEARNLRRFVQNCLKCGQIYQTPRSNFFNFSRQLKMKPVFDNDHQVIVEISNDLWFRAMEVDEETKRQDAKETKAHLEATVFQRKPEANKWLYLTLLIAGLGMDALSGAHR